MNRSVDNPFFKHDESSAHVVQFYEDEAFLLDTLSSYVGGALLGGDAAIVIATAAHRNGLTSRMKQRGLDFSEPLREGWLVLLDAAETLDSFMVDGWPDEMLFAQLAAAFIEPAQLAAPGRQHRLAAFGEMVAILAAQGHYRAAVRLEQLWNDLGREFRFALRCAYPLDLFRGNHEAMNMLSRVCMEHTHIIPSESAGFQQHLSASLESATIAPRD